MALKFWGTHFVIDIFCKFQFLNCFISYNDVQFLTTSAQLSARLKNFLRGWLLVLGLKEGLVECATVCVKSVVILIYMHLHQSTLRKGVFFPRPKLVLWFDRYFRHNQNEERDIKNHVGFCRWFLAHVSKILLNLLASKLRTGIRLHYKTRGHNK